MKKHAPAEKLDASPPSSSDVRVLGAVERSAHARPESNQWFPSLAVLPAVSGPECAAVLARDRKSVV